MEVILEKKESLKKLASEVEIYPQVLKNVRVKDKKAAQEDEEVVRKTEEISKRLGDDGRILMRASGTEPVIRVMVEAKTTEICESSVDEVIKVISERGLMS